MSGARTLAAVPRQQQLAWLREHEPKTFAQAVDVGRRQELDRCLTLLRAAADAHGGRLSPRSASFKAACREIEEGPKAPVETRAERMQRALASIAKNAKAGVYYDGVSTIATEPD
ncbi:MAG: hypothetical protein WBG86_16405 [Polyangiales bacterium]